MAGSGWIQVLFYIPGIIIVIHLLVRPLLLRLWERRQIRRRLRQQRMGQTADTETGQESIREMAPEQMFVEGKDESWGREVVREESFVCAVCLEDVEAHTAVAALACGHDFHVACVAKWAQRSDTCPICRMKQNSLSTNTFLSTSQSVSTVRERGGTMTSSADDQV